MRLNEWTKNCSMVFCRYLERISTYFLPLESNGLIAEVLYRVLPTQMIPMKTVNSETINHRRVNTTLSNKVGRCGLRNGKYTAITPTQNTRIQAQNMLVNTFLWSWDCFFCRSVSLAMIRECSSQDPGGVFLQLSYMDACRWTRYCVLTKISKADYTV